jgi:hypothetical protein
MTAAAAVVCTLTTVAYLRPKVCSDAVIKAHAHNASNAVDCVL